MRERCSSTLFKYTTIPVVPMQDPVSLPPDLLFFERGWLSSNSLMQLGQDGQALLVDSGYVAHEQQTLALVQQALKDTHQLTHLVNTHLHSDHCGGNHILQSYFPPMQTHIPALDAEAVAGWDESRLTYLPTGQHCKPFRSDHSLVSGACIDFGSRRWEIHACPGHDDHAVMLFEPTDRILISGDALWENGFGVVFPQIEGDGGFDRVEDSLNLINELHPRLVVPGHGRVFSDVESALQRAHSRLTQFRKSPNSHDEYAAKVLIKFKLLEWQSIERAHFLAWADQNVYLTSLFAKSQTAADYIDWLEQVLKQLEAAGACSLTTNNIVNA